MFPASIIHRTALDFKPFARRRGFSLIEVILAVGVITVALVALIGLIGPTLAAVEQAQDLNAGIACISKLSAQLDAAPFYNSQNTSTLVKSQNVYTWIEKSAGGTITPSPTVFLFYNELPSKNLIPDPNNLSLVQKVIRYNRAQAVVNTSHTDVTPNNMNSDLVELAQHISNGLVSGPIIAMTLSLSPLARNFVSPDNPRSLWTTVYLEPAPGSIFPGNNLPPDDPNKVKLTGTPQMQSVAYPEAYMPILVQVFSLQIDKAANTNWDPSKDLTLNNRLFTYTTAKLR